LVRGWTAGCAVGLAYALGSGHGDRLGVCAGPGCERVFVDVSRNGSRRFCGTACQNRVKAADYRARRREAEGSRGDGG
jgi:predicted RNA-binding Zn ribbon-like protein